MHTMLLNLPDKRTGMIGIRYECPAFRPPRVTSGRPVSSLGTRPSTRRRIIHLEFDHFESLLFPSEIIPKQNSAYKTYRLSFPLFN